MKKKSVAIIGGGAAGLVAAKSALEADLNCTVFESTAQFGGVWSPLGSAWPTMRVNISRFTGVFSDFPWEQAFPNQEINDYPTSQEMFDYLCAYVKHFKLESVIQYNCHVMQVRKNKVGWTVQWQNDNKIKTAEYDAVIVASGRYQNPYQPAFKGLENFKGEVIHSSAYRSKNNFISKKVLLVGGSLSSVAIAEDIADVTHKLWHLIRRPRWILPRYFSIQSGKLEIKVPRDLIYSRNNYQPRDYAWYLHHCEKQNQNQEWRMDPEIPSATVIADDYLEMINKKMITVIKNDIAEFTESGVFLKNQQELALDSVIFCTGYQQDFSYFENAIADQLKKPLYEDTFPPEISELACIGINYQLRGAIFPLVELQARVACAVFRDKITLPSVEKMQTEAAITASGRDGFTFSSALARMLDLLDFSEISKSDPHLYNLIMEGVMIPAHYRLVGFGCNPDLAKSVILLTEKYRQRKMLERQCQIGIKQQ